jgi:hypothetical protein
MNFCFLNKPLGKVTRRFILTISNEHKQQINTYENENK